MLESIVVRQEHMMATAGFEASAYSSPRHAPDITA